MHKIGLKLWSTNRNYIDEAKRLYEEKIYDYIELYIFPGSLNEYIDTWKQLKMPFVIHAPHHTHGMNLSLAENQGKNIKLAEEAFKFADSLKSEFIIFHPGVGGKVEESAKQFKLLNDSRITIENKPYFGLKDDVCIGYSPEDIRHLLNETGYKFCLDIAHAVFAANALNKDSIEYVKQFIGLKPVLYHICDGDFNDKYDTHMNLGKGIFPLKKLVQFIPKNSLVTIETDKNSESNLDDFKKDILLYNSIIN